MNTLRRLNGCRSGFQIEFTPPFGSLAALAIGSESAL